MTRRVGVGYAALSLMLDAALVWVALALAEYWRPGLAWVPLSRAVGDSDMVPLPLYVAIALLGVAALLAVRLYDTSATVEFGGELRALVLGSGFAALATAGLLYLSYRDVSRWLFLLFAGTAFALLLSRRLLARLLTAALGWPPVRRRRVLVVGAGPIAEYVGSRITAHDRQELTLLGYLDEPDRVGAGVPVLGSVGDANDRRGRESR